MRHLFFLASALIFSFTSAFAADSLENLSLDQYIKKHGFNWVEDHCCKGNTSQPEYFKNLLLCNPDIHVIGEVGFNAGHSSNLYLQAREDTEVYSFDLMAHPYVSCGKKFIDTKYPGRHKLIKGESKQILPKFIKQNKELSFDLVFIDGDHAFNSVLADLINMRRLSHEKTIVVIDDFKENWPVKQAYQICLKHGLIHEGKEYQSGDKVWLETTYNYAPLKM